MKMLPESAAATAGVAEAGRTIFRYRYVLLGVLTLCYMVQYLNRVQIPVLMPSISKSLGMSEVEFGRGMTLMMLFYGPSQWFTGWICDRIGSRRTLVFSVLAWSAMTAWLALMQSVNDWYIRMALFGLLVGTEFVPSARLLVRWFPARQRATAQSIFSWAWIITPAWAPLAITKLFSGLGENWHTSFLIVAAAGLVPLALILWFVFDRPEHCGRVSRQELAEAYEAERAQGIVSEEDLASGQIGRIEQKAKAVRISFWEILTTRGFLPVVAVMVVSQQLFWGMMTWSAKYLAEVHHFSMKDMGAWACVYFAGGAAGSLLSSWVSDTVLGGRRRPMILACFACTIPFVLLLANIQPGVAAGWLLLALTGAGFFANMVWGPTLATPADLFPAEVYGRAIGFVNCMGYVLAAACPTIMGYLIREDAVTQAKDYHLAWTYIAAMAVLGIVAGCFMVDRRRKA